MHEILRSTKLLTRSEERALLERVATGDPEARDQLIRANTALVMSIAASYTKRGVDIEDLFSEGLLGLIHAIECFNIQFTVKFSTYATHVIHQAMQRCLGNHGRLIRAPLYIWDLHIRFERAKCRYPDLSDEEICKKANIKLKKLKFIRQLPSLCEELADIRSKGDNDPSELCALNDELELTRQTMKTLTYRQREAIQMRYGLDGSPEYTLKEIGKILGVTKEGARILIIAGLEKLKAERMQVSV